jgi:phytoene dehydrogenase-like protein
MRRREFLGGVAGTVLASCAPRPERPALGGADASAGLQALGHRYATPFVRGVAADTADVVIVGAGVAGLSAAWRLADLGMRVRVLELWTAPGGTAIAGTGDRGPYPWGAHYLTLPGPECLHVRRLLREVGVITGEEDGRPFYSSDALCYAPEERIWDAGTWIEGLWPAAHATEVDNEQKRRWDAVVAEWSARVGNDGLFAFNIPVAKSSRDPAIRGLTHTSFAAWLDEQGFTAPVLRWWLEYATRDDYGTRLADTSTWAGLHYFCARRPDPGDARDLGTHVLTWPAGNGWLIERLARHATVETGKVVRAIEPDGARVRVWGDDFGITADQVILAVPTRLLPRWGLTTADTPDHAPWRVAQLQVSALPRAHGVQTAWDNVVYGAAGLGYVNSAHQTGSYGGPAVLTWYQPVLGAVGPARAEVAAETWEDVRDRVLADLSPSHPDLLDVLERVDVWRWGHGTVRPTVGLHDGRLDALATLAPNLFVAHTDLSGVSLFEEASYHGVRAAEAALLSMGRAVETWL